MSTKSTRSFCQKLVWQKNSGGSFYLNLSIFTAFLKNKNIIFKIRRSKVTDYAALKGGSMKKCNIHYTRGDFICFQMSIYVAQ